MEIAVPISISSIGVIISVISFVLSRKDKNTKDVKEEQKQFDKHEIIEYRLGRIDQQLEKISAKLEANLELIDKRVGIALKNHVEAYHRTEK